MYVTYHPYYMCNICNIIRLTRELLATMLIFMKAYLNASEVAKLLRVDRATVSRWAKRGVIKGAIRPDNTRQWRIPLDAYEKIVSSGKLRKSPVSAFPSEGQRRQPLPSALLRR